MDSDSVTKSVTKIELGEVSDPLELALLKLQAKLKEDGPMQLSDAIDFLTSQMTETTKPSKGAV